MAKRTKTKTGRKASKKPAKASQSLTHRTIRVPVETYNRAQAMLDKAAARGWAAFGSDRGDRPTLGTIVDEGLRHLEQNVGSKPATVTPLIAAQSSADRLLMTAAPCPEPVQDTYTPGDDPIDDGDDATSPAS